MTSITFVRDQRGDDEVHITGCADLKRGSKFQPGIGWGTFKGETLLDAIVAADTDMAEAFGEEPYSDPATQGSQPWSTEIIRHAPCFVKELAAEGITFSGPFGRPEGK